MHNSLYNNIIKNIAKSVKQIINEADQTSNALIKKVLKFQRTIDYSAFNKDLHNYVIVFMFLKKDGTPKLTFGTTKDEYLSLLNAGNPPIIQKENNQRLTYIQYYDISVRDWRTISLDKNIKQVIVPILYTNSARAARDYMQQNNEELYIKYNKLLSTNPGKDTEYCAYSSYNNVSQKDVEDFWSNSYPPIYKGYEKNSHNILDLDKITKIEDIKPEFRPALNTARKNVAMLDRAIDKRPSVSIFFDKSSNIYLKLPYNSSYQLYNYYANKQKKYFKTYTLETLNIKEKRYSAEIIQDNMPWRPDENKEIDLNELQLLYNGTGESLFDPIN